MKTLRLIVNNPIGIHARPAALLAQACTNLKSSVLIKCNDKEAAGNNVLQILSLGAKKGDCLTIEIEGGDEELACRQIMDIMTDFTAQPSEPFGSVFFPFLFRTFTNVFRIEHLIGCQIGHTFQKHAAMRRK